MLKDMKVLTIENEHCRFKILNYGLRILEFSIITDDNVRRNIVLEYDNLEENKTDEFFLNSIIGPFAGRLANGKYTLKDEVRQYIQNEGSNALHGSEEALHDQFFEIEKGQSFIVANLTTEKVDYEIKYELIGTTLLIEMSAVPKINMYINMTQHTYFNLNGDSTIKDHYLEIPSDYSYILDEDSIPVQKEMIKNSVFDFNKSKNIGNVLSQNHPQFKITKNIDHPYLLRDNYLTLNEEKFGIELFVETDASHCVVYLGNHLGNNPLRLSNGRILRDYAGIALEPQCLPDDVNQTGDSIYSTNHPFRRMIKYTINRK